MSIKLLELAADVLDDLLPRVVFVGGATVGLWITDPGAPAVRPTKDVDVVVQVVTHTDFHAFEDALRAKNLSGDHEDGVICRWRHTETGLILDAMPARADILGFENRWQAAAIPHAVQRELPSGARIRAASPPYLIATKLEAFTSRGRGDLLTSRDFGDVIALFDGRPELVEEIRTSEPDVREFISRRVRALLDAPRIDDGLAGAVPPDAASQARVDEVILPAMQRLCGPSE